MAVSIGETTLRTVKHVSLFVFLWDILFVFFAHHVQLEMRFGCLFFDIKGVNASLNFYVVGAMPRKRPAAAAKRPAAAVKRPACEKPPTRDKSPDSIFQESDVEGPQGTDPEGYQGMAELLGFIVEPHDASSNFKSNCVLFA